MDWLALSILSSVFFALSNVIDKQIVGRYLRDPKACVFLAVCFDTIYALLIAVATGFVLQPSRYFLAALLSGIVYVVEVMIYFFSIKHENVSMVIAILMSSPLYTLLLAVLFLGERVTVAQAAGILLVVAGSMVVSVRKGEGRHTVSGMLLPSVVASFLLGASAVLVKYSLASLSFYDSVVARQIGSFLAVLPIGIILVMRQSGGQFRNPKPVLFSGASEAVFMVGMMVFTLASSLGPISLVSAAGAVQPLFVLFWIFLLGKRHLSAHETGIENMKPVALGTILIMGGIYLIS